MVSTVIHHHQPRNAHYHTILRTFPINTNNHHWHGGHDFRHNNISPSITTGRLRAHIKGMMLLILHDIIMLV